MALIFDFLMFIREHRTTVQLTFVLLFGLWLASAWLKYKRAVSVINNHPGYRTLLSNDILGNMIPRIRGVALGYDWGMKYRFKMYSSVGWDLVSQVSVFPKIKTGYLVADPIALRDIVPHRYRWPKPTEDYEILTGFGSNILTTEGEEWKKHRKLASPTFSEKNNKLVWDETLYSVEGLFDVWGRDNNQIVLENVTDITVQITLMIISIAGFGRRLSWQDDYNIPPGHTMSFQNAMHTVSSTLQLRFIAPNWAYRFSKRLQLVRRANNELNMYLQEMLEARRNAEVREERYDLFSALLDESDSEKSRLTDEEIIGDIFLFLVAGHETTAHTTAFALGLLALEQEEQEELYRHITSIIADDEVPEYEHMNQLTHVLAVIYEALRLFPPVAYIPKKSAEDQTLPYMRPDGTMGTAIVPKGTRATLNTTGLHYNPRYWPDPEAFSPSRFLELDWPRDAFLAFSAGPRACLGRKFAETEMVAMLTLIVRRYKIEPAHPELYAGLSPAGKRAKLLASLQGVTTTPIKVPLLFRRR